MKIKAIAALWILIVTLFIPIESVYGQKTKKTIISAVSSQQLRFLKQVEKKYQNEHGIHITLKKTVKIETLASETNSTGEVWFLSGKMNLDIASPIASKIISDGKYLWLVSPAPKEFKGARTQVTQAALDSKRARSQGLIQLLTQGGLLKYFKPVGVKKKGDRLLYFLQPKTQSAEFKRAQLTIDPSTKVISELHYWDRNDSETIFEFLKTEFNQTLKKSLFIYQPPKDADITTL